MALLHSLIQPTFAIFGAGPLELVVVLVVLLVLFGSRLPGVMRSLGQGITEFKKGVRDDVDSPDSITEDQDAS
jgi:sec-independent protein translocase protein TatA